MGSALLPTRRSADGRFRGALPRESLPRRRQRCRRDNQRAASPWPPRAGPPEPRAVLPQRKPRRGVCPNSVSKRAFNAKVPADPRSSAAAHVEVHMRSLSLAAPCTYTRMLSAGSGRARSAPARNGGRRPSHPTAAGHSAAVADALEDEGWPGCQGSRASATGYDRALLALSRVLNPTTRATRRHTASMRTFDESLAWPLRTLRSA